MTRSARVKPAMGLDGSVVGVHVPTGDTLSCERPARRSVTRTPERAQLSGKAHTFYSNKKDRRGDTQAVRKANVIEARMHLQYRITNTGRLRATNVARPRPVLRLLDRS